MYACTAFPLDKLNYIFFWCSVTILLIHAKLLMQENNCHMKTQDLQGHRIMDSSFLLLLYYYDYYCYYFI